MTLSSIYTAVRIIFLMLLLCPLSTVHAQDDSTKPIQADVITISSKILHEDRRIYIYSSVKGSLHPDKACPVLYLMDGESHSGLLSEYIRYLSRWDVNVIPEMIVVGITNTNRTRDLTPTHSIINYRGVPDTSATSWLKPSGGNEQFLQFIREELMPYVESHYKTQPFKIFAGHSFGGIAAVNCLLTHADMFNAYVAISPSFWWDREYMLHLTNEKLKEASTLNKILFYSDASEGVADSSTFHTNLIKFDSLLAKKRITGLEYKYVYYPEDIHMTEPIKGYYDALRFIYAQWEVPPQNPMRVTGSILMNHYNKLSKKYGYTILPNENNINDWASYLMTDAKTLDNAISLFEMNASNYPTSSKVFASLGDAYAKKGDKKKAIASYQKAIALNSKAEDVSTKLKALQGSR
jgi:hypothetical protein